MQPTLPASSLLDLVAAAGASRLGGECHSSSAPFYKGLVMTAPSPTPKNVSIPRGVLIGGAALLVVLLIGVAVLVGVMIGGGSSPAAEASAAPVASERASAAPKATQAPAPVEPEPETFGIGDTFTTGNVTLTIHSVEVADSVATTEGSPLTPDTGGQLLLIKTTYSNSKTQADLSCGNTDLYIQVFDTEEREMAPVFENYRVPGNPGCNDHLLQGTPHEWNLVFQSVAGASPLAISVTETAKWLDPVWVDIQP